MSEERLTELLNRVTPEPPISIDLARMAQRIVEDTDLQTTSRPRRQLVPALIAAAAVAAIAAASVTIVVHRADQPQPASDSTGPAPTGQEVKRAREVLARWDKAVGDSPYVPVAREPGQGSNRAAWQFLQVGKWPQGAGPSAGEQVALRLRDFAVRTPLSTTRPAAGRVVWADGQSAAVPVLSPAETLEQLRAGAEECAGCKPGEIDGVKSSTLPILRVTLTKMPVQTTRGPATVPAYSFSFEGSPQVALQAAVAPPAMTPLGTNGQEFYLPIDSATVSADRLTLTVHFTGAPLPGSEACGVDYGTYAVESSNAVAVAVTDKPHAEDELCNSAGKEREAVVHLKSPLADRVVLQSSTGTAIPVTS